MFLGRCLMNKYLLSGRCRIFPQIALAIGVLTVLVKGPWMVSRLGFICRRSFLLLFTVLGDTYLQKHLVKLKFKGNFCILAERCITFCVQDTSGDLKPQVLKKVRILKMDSPEGETPES